ncbi:tetratricopeptide repeat protein [Actinoplanes sp. NPDC020271]|uniref:tetratricopeptide repeat protein n=1 Tax=Actinoplanes sp. NPDC020271 TaxID=3363896 RepID=UPI00378855FC
MTPQATPGHSRKSVFAGPWRWPLIGLGAFVVGTLIMPIGQLWWYLPLAVVGELFLLWDARRQVMAAHPAVLEARLRQVLGLLTQDRPDAALAHLEALLPDLDRVLGPDHPHTLSAQTLHLRLRGDRGDLPDRVGAMAELVARQQRLLGPDHEETLASRYQHADWLAEDGDPGAAQEAYRSLITDATRALGADHSTVLISRSSLAILRHQAGEKNALADLKTVAADMERALGPDNPATISTRNLLTRWDTA